MAGVAGILFAPPPRDSRTRRSLSKPRNPLNPLAFSPPPRNRGSSSTGAGDLRLGYRLRSDEREFEWASDGGGFDRAVSLFNGGDYHACHDVLEDLWNVAEEPRRTLIHGILQCAVGFHHLFNKVRRLGGAMMELGEGLCKLRKMGFESGPFYRFEEEVSAALDFLYKTQMELAACANDLCLTMDGSERSYQLLGTFAAGQRLYSLENDDNGVSHIVFYPDGPYQLDKLLKVKLPTLHATDEHLKACEYS